MGRVQCAGCGVVLPAGFGVPCTFVNSALKRPIVSRASVSLSFSDVISCLTLLFTSIIFSRVREMSSSTVKYEKCEKLKKLNVKIVLTKFEENVKIPKYTHNLCHDCMAHEQLAWNCWDIVACTVLVLGIRFLRMIRTPDLFSCLVWKFHRQQLAIGTIWGCDKALRAAHLDRENVI